MRVLLWKWQQYTINQSIAETKKIIQFQKIRPKRKVFKILKNIVNSKKMLK